MNLLMLAAVVLALVGRSADLELSSLRQALYPDGLPLRVNPSTGEFQEVILAVPVKLPTTTNVWFVLVTEEVRNTAALDSYFRVFAVGLTCTNATLAVTSRTNLTDMISNYTEEPGHFSRVTAEASLVGPRPGKWLKLALTSTLSGSGSRSVRDVFFFKAASDSLILAQQFPSQYSSFRLGDEAQEVEHYRLSCEVEETGNGLLVRKTKDNITTEFRLR